jgi:hypothetical protein
MGWGYVTRDFAPPGFGIKAKLLLDIGRVVEDFAPPGFGIKAKLESQEWSG